MYQWIIEVVKAHGKLFAICDVQDGITGKWSYIMRQVEESDDGYTFTVKLGGEEVDVTEDAKRALER